MCQVATRGRTIERWLAVLAVCTLSASAQTRLDWRSLGNLTIADAASAGPASGPIERVWYGSDGRLFARAFSGKTFETRDFETWAEVSAANPPPSADAVRRFGATFYTLDGALLRSDDSGQTWRNLTDFRNSSILGGPPTDLAVSAADLNDISVATGAGVWRSLDGGLSWNSLNLALPNFPAARILSPPSAGRSGLRVALADGREAVWAPGERKGWRLQQASSPRRDLVVLGGFVYAGAPDGRLLSSTDGGNTWREFQTPDAARVVVFHVDPREPQIALAVLEGRGAQILRTTNGGIFWDDLTANLPKSGTRGIAADLASGAVYAATSTGVYMTLANLRNAAPATAWQRIDGGLPAASAFDAALDAGADQLYVALEGYGIWRTLAPHRLADPRVVNAADFARREAAPGSLLSVLGSKVASAKMGETEVPILGASETESQIQVPFEATGNQLSLRLNGRPIDLPLRPVAPAIFIDRDGAPMILDAERGILLDAQMTATGGSRIQILATGLGRVTPEWPSGLAAPMEAPPSVNVPITVFLDRVPLQVTRATLAPGYVGFYLVEAELPAVVNPGPAELFLQAEGAESNRVTLYLQP